MAATTNRTSGRLAPRKSRMLPPNRMTSTTSGRSRASRSGTPTKTTLPAMRQPAPRAPDGRGHLSTPPMIGSSEAMIAIVSAMRLPGHEQADGLEVDEARVVDAHPERLVRAVADGVGRVLAARALDGRVGATRSRPQEARQLGHDRAVGHLVEALVDDPEALLDLVHAEQVAGQAVALGAGRDVEVELRVDAVRVRPADVERHAGRPQVRAGHAHPQGRLRVDDAEAAHPADEDLVLVEEAEFRCLELVSSRGSSSRPRRLMNSWFRSPLTPPIRK